MPSSYTTRNRLTKPATGELTNVWGTTLNSGVFDLVDFAADGWTNVSSGGATTLTTANGTTDQARARVINITATTAATITIPNVEKAYLVRAASTTVDHIITNGSSSVTVTRGDVAWVITDGTTIYLGPRLRGFASPTRDSDPSTKKYVDDTAFAMTEDVFPGLTGKRTRNLRVNPGETNAEWEPDEITKTANYTAAVGDRIAADTSAATFTIVLPPNPEEGDQLWIRDAGNSTSNQGWRTNPLILDPGDETIRGDSDPTTSLDLKGVRVSVQFHDNEWNLTIG